MMHQLSTRRDRYEIKREQRREIVCVSASAESDLFVCQMRWPLITSKNEQITAAAGKDMDTELLPVGRTHQITNATK